MYLGIYLYAAKSIAVCTSQDPYLANENYSNACVIRHTAFPAPGLHYLRLTGMWWKIILLGPLCLPVGRLRQPALPARPDGCALSHLSAHGLVHHVAHRCGG